MTSFKREEKKRKERKVYKERKEKKRREIYICNVCLLFILLFWSLNVSITEVKRSHIITITFD
jgi:hypothetical protein